MRDPKDNKSDRSLVAGEVRVTADAGDFGPTTSFPAPSFGSGSPDDDDWTEAEANAFMDELVERNKKALRGLAKL